MEFNNLTILPLKNMVFNNLDEYEMKIKTNNLSIRNTISEYKTSTNSKYNIYNSIDPTDLKKIYENSIKDKESNKNQFAGFNFEKNKDIISQFCSNNNSYIIDENPKLANTLRLITFNVHSFASTCNNIIYDKLGNSKQDNSISNESTDDIANFINQLDPDLLFMQEFAANKLNPDKTGYQLSYFYDKVKIFNDVHYTLLDDVENFVFNKNIVLLFNASFSRLPINEKNTYVFPSNRKFSYIKVLVENEVVEIFNIHPAPFYGNDGEYKIKYDFEYLSNLFNGYDTINRNIIILGDFNTYHKQEYLDENGKEYMSNPHNFLTDKGFNHLYDIKNNLYEYDFTGQHLTTIDYIYISNKFLANFEIVKNKILNVNLSDHYPLLLDFKLRNQKILDNSLNWFLNIWPKGKQSINNLVFDNTDLYKSQEEKYNLFKPVYINFNKFLEKYNYEVINVPKGQLFCHRSDVINFENTNRPFELINSDNINNKLFDKLMLKNDSTVSNLFISESFTYIYGKNLDNHFGRLIYYKTNKSIKLIKITGKTKRNRLSARLVFYKNLLKYILDTNILLKDVVPEWVFNDDTNPWNYQGLIQLVTSLTVLKSNNFNNLIHGIVGFLIEDGSQTELNNQVNTNRYLQNAWFWNKVTLTQGIEFDLYCKEYFTDYYGTKYKNNLYLKDEFKSKYNNFTNNIILLNKETKKFKKSYNYDQISQYNLNYVKLSTLKEQFFNLIDLTNNKFNLSWFLDVLSPFDEVNLFNNQNLEILILNLNLNFFINSLLQAKYFYNEKTIDKIIEPPYDNSLIDSLNFDFTNNENKNVYNLINLFKVFFDEKKKIFINLNNNKSYVLIIIHFVIKYMIAHEYINLPLLTLFKFLFKYKNHSKVDERYINIIKKILGEDYVNFIINNDTIQLVIFNPSKLKNEYFEYFFKNNSFGYNTSNYNTDRYIKTK